MPSLRGVPGEVCRTCTVHVQKVVGTVARTEDVRIKYSARTK